MKIAIHHSPESYSPQWINYCKENKIDYKTVCCYDNDIINQVSDCDIVMWHHNQAFPNDFLIAKQILFSLEMAGKTVYPDWRTGWYFDDKLGQKYLFESLNLPHVNYHAFYDESSALEWLKTTKFPVVFKLRGGAGSSNVMLLKNYKEASTIVKKMFSSGIRPYNVYQNIRDSFKFFQVGKGTLKDLAKALAHLVVPYKLEKSRGREKGYVLFQDFVPNLKSDIRVQVVGNKCYAMERFVRENDFRASGSGKIEYDGSKISKDLIKLSFELSEKIQAQSVAFDFVNDKEEYKLIEVSYCWGVDEGELDPGFWDRDLNWHPGRINPFAWMMQDVIKSVKQ